MKLKNKLLAVLLIIFAILLMTTGIVEAKDELTYEDKEQQITWGYELDDNGNVVNLRCTTIEEIPQKVTIPLEIDGKTVISIADIDFYTGAFMDATGLIEVTIPNTIKIIGDYAFKNCSGLKRVTIPESVTKIGQCAFQNCSGLTSITLSTKLTKIENYAFAGCVGIKEITIPDSVTTLGDATFDGCKGLKNITLSNRLTKIGQRTFNECSGLTSIVLPETITTIEGSYFYGAFRECTNLEKILIPDSVASIEEDSFKGCKKLTIYGNDNQESKRFAEEYEIPFDYIENWDKESSGKDITPPIVGRIQVTHASVMKYNKDSNTNMYIVPAGAKMVINVEFNEPIEGTEVPILTIKFGEGENIELTEGTVNGSKITYIYTIKSADKGTMTTVSLKGGKITDGAGNQATLTCPGLSIQYDTFNEDLIYANGTATNPEGSNPEGSNPEGSNPEGSNPEGSNPEGSNPEGNNPDTGKQEGKEEGKKDPTITQQKIPNAGKATIFSVFIVVILAGTISFTKVRKYKDV